MHTQACIFYDTGVVTYIHVVRRQKLRGEPLCIDCGFTRHKLFKRVPVFMQMITYNIFNVYSTTDVVKMGKKLVNGTPKLQK